MKALWQPSFRRLELDVKHFWCNSALYWTFQETPSISFWIGYTVFSQSVITQQSL